MKQCSLFLLLITLLLSMTQTFAEEGVATVIIMRGEVKAKEKNSENIITVTKGMWIKEGTVLQSAPKSFAKLLFIDKSEMSLGPESQMVISSFPKDQAGILTLVKGQLRSKVTKDYMEMADKDKSKLYIKTKSAAMGVRGTDFQVNFDRNTSATTLVTFSGAVAMAQLSEAAGRSFDRTNLESTLHSKEAVLVQKGEFAGTSPQQQATPPEKLPTDKLEALKSSDGTLVVKEIVSELVKTAVQGEVKEEKKEEKEEKEDKKEDKKEEEKKEDKKEEKKEEAKKEDKKEEKKDVAAGPAKSIVPPGLSADMVKNVGGGELEKSLAASLGTTTLSELKAAAVAEIKETALRAPASVDGSLMPPPPPPSSMPSMLPPPPPPPVINDQQLNNILNNTYKTYENAPPPVIPDANTRVRLIFH